MNFCIFSQSYEINSIKNVIYYDFHQTLIACTSLGNRRCVCTCDKFRNIQLNYSCSYVSRVHGDDSPPMYSYQRYFSA